MDRSIQLTGESAAVMGKLHGDEPCNDGGFLVWFDARVPSNIVVAETHWLFVHPNPGEPKANVCCGWSVELRQAYLQGIASFDPVKLFERLIVQIYQFVVLPSDQAVNVTAALALPAPLILSAFKRWNLLDG